MLYHTQSFYEAVFASLTSFTLSDFCAFTSRYALIPDYNKTRVSKQNKNMSVCLGTHTKKKPSTMNKSTDKHSEVGLYRTGGTLLFS